MKIEKAAQGQANEGHQAEGTKKGQDIHIINYVNPYSSVCRKSLIS